MKFRFYRETVLQILDPIIPFIDHNAHTVALRRIVFDATEHEVRVSGANNTSECVYHYDTAENNPSNLQEIVINSPGSCALPAKRFYDLVRYCPEGAQIILTSTESKIELQLPTGRCSFANEASEDEPVLSLFDGKSDDATHKIELSSDKLYSILSAVVVAAAKQDVRYYLNGVCIDQSSTWAATDGHRMIIISGNTPEPGSKQWIMPIDSVQRLLKLCRQFATEEGISLLFNTASFQITFKKVTFISKLIDGKFPDYTPIVKASRRHSVTIDHRALVQATKRAALFVAENEPLILDLSSNLCTIYAGKNDTLIEELVAEYTGPDIRFGVNSAYLSDFLSLFESEGKITMRFEDSNSSLQWVDDTNRTFIIMPMRV